MNAAQKHQLELLKQAGSPTAFWLLGLFLLGLGIGTLVTHHIVFIVLFLFFTMVALGSIDTIKLLRRAIRAIEEGKIFQTQAIISIDKSSDDDQYYVQVQDSYQRWWKFQFMPQHWKPTPDKIEVNAYFLEGIEYPVLLIGNEGVLVPRYKPEFTRH